MAWIYRQQLVPMESQEFLNMNSIVAQKSFWHRPFAYSPWQRLPIPNDWNDQVNSIEIKILFVLATSDFFTFNIVELQLQSSISANPISVARSPDIWLHGAFNVPDWMMPRRASPFVTGDNKCKLTALPPADSPNNVIKSGSPPNARAFSFNHRIANAWSHIPAFPVEAKWNDERREITSTKITFVTNHSSFTSDCGINEQKKQSKKYSCINCVCSFLEEKNLCSSECLVCKRAKKNSSFSTHGIFLISSWLCFHSLFAIHFLLVFGSLNNERWRLQSFFKWIDISLLFALHFTNVLFFVLTSVWTSLVSIEFFISIILSYNSSCSTQRADTYECEEFKWKFNKQLCQMWQTTKRQ